MWGSRTQQISLKIFRCVWKLGISCIYLCIYLCKYIYIYRIYMYTPHFQCHFMIGKGWWTNEFRGTLLPDKPSWRSPKLRLNKECLEHKFEGLVTNKHMVSEIIHRSTNKNVDLTDEEVGDWNGGVVPNTLWDIIKIQMLYLHTHIMLSGWWLSHPSEKYEGQLGLLFPIYI